MNPRRIDFIKELNEAQKKAVRDYQGPSLVIAGAGSGKTRVLTYRIAYLLFQGINPHRILALTFTNKAANEMKERIGKLVGTELARWLWMGTFHSIFARILRTEGKLLGFPSSYSIYDPIDSKSMIKSIIREMNLDDRTYKPGEVFGRISAAKNNLITPQAYMQNNELLEADKRSKKPHLAEIYKRYVHKCKQAGAMDFDDLLMNTYLIFRDHEDVLKKYQEYFHYILVDEYQDTNLVQYMIINKLSENHRNLCVVGDDAQSIYSFRGARIENILNFQHDYPGYKLFKLEQNYRSTRNIVKAANGVIARNREQIKKNLWSDNPEGEKILLLRNSSDQEEGFNIANRIKEDQMRSHLRNQDFAILYRTNAQSRIFEEALRKMNIPYRVYGSLSFYERKEIKDLLAYLRLTVNPLDDEALKRIINYPARGIGKTTLNKLEQLSQLHRKPLWEILNRAGSFPGMFNKGTINKLEHFATMMRGFQKQLKSMEAFDLAMTIAKEAGVLKDLHYEQSPENITRWENIQELLNGIKIFQESREEGEDSSLDAFLQNVALLTDMDTEDPEDRDRVTIMTVHSAKGLEFKNVYVTGLEEELFPSAMSMYDPRGLEEERRLFYVAMTRAMNKLVISYAETRMRFGLINYATPSRFIQDIDESFIEYPLDYSGGMTRKETKTDFIRLGKVQKSRSRLRRIDTAEPAENTPSENNEGQSGFSEEDFTDPSGIQAGMRVIHPRFGEGKVLQIEGDMPNTKATVFFKGYGNKQLLLKFAKLKVVP